MHWPTGIDARNEFRSSVAHVIDIAPTILDLAGVTADTDGPRMSGKSLIPAIRKGDAVVHDELWFYHEGNRALRQGDWKIIHSNVSRTFPWRNSKEARGENGAEPNWHLYNLSSDRAEQEDLSDSQPERVEAMVAKWEELRLKFLKDSQSDTTED